MLLNPQAYIDLFELFPSPPCKEEDVQAFELPPTFRLFLVGPTKHDVVLVCKRPPLLLHHDRKTLKWVQIAGETR